jgi:Spy/CpxP family protein refolding chaperone
MKTRILSSIIVVSFFISTALMAQPNKGQKPSDNYSQKKEMMKKRSDRGENEFQNFFTEEQKEQMKELRLETVKKVKPLKNELGELMARQQTLATADKADLKAINKNIDEMSDLKADIAKIMAAQHQQIRSLLTEEQLVKFDSMKGKRGLRQGMERGNVRRPGRGA